MQKVEASTGISIKNILFLTDFSEPSEVALPFATSIARGYGAKVYALHVFTPDPNVCGAPAKLAIAAIETGEQHAKARVDSQLTGLEHETIVDWSIDLWDAVQRTINENHIDLIVMGTHGRTGVDKFFMGSVAEEIFRRSTVPVLTIGPHVRSSVHAGGRFHRILFPTDFTAASEAASPYAISLAQENKAKLVLLHVMRIPNRPMATDATKVGMNMNAVKTIRGASSYPSPKPFIIFMKLFQPTPIFTCRHNQSSNMATRPSGYFRQPKNARRI